jgi:hypothetical protein
MIEVVVVLYALGVVCMRWPNRVFCGCFLERKYICERTCNN